MSENHSYGGYHLNKTELDRSEKIDHELAQVGPGSPCGEYLRRFWQPVAMAKQVTDVPLLVRRMGEDLVLFRDKTGRYGLVFRHCAHRNASLEFGIPTERGLRCCYHGWLYDVDGSLIETPSEPPNSPLCDQIRIGAYPVREYKGLIFAYMGPPEEIPPFPIFDTSEIEGGEVVPYEVTQPCNWLQIAENSVDPLHVVFLHTRVNEVQFTEKLGIFPVIEWNPYDLGLFYTKGRRMGDYVWISTNDVVLPNFTQAGCVYDSTDGETPKYFGRNSFTRWIVPVDDEHTTILAFRHFNPHAEESREEWRTPEALEIIDISQLKNRPYYERQRNPGDYEAFVGQSAITAHKMEHLGKSDHGVIMYRKMLRQAVRQLQQGQAPLQPGAQRSNPIPTYGSDTVIYWPQIEGQDDEASIKELLKKTGETYRSADDLVGEARFDYLASALADLNKPG